MTQQDDASSSSSGPTDTDLVEVHISHNEVHTITDFNLQEDKIIRAGQVILGLGEGVMPGTLNSNKYQDILPGNYIYQEVIPPILNEETPSFLDTVTT